MSLLVPAALGLASLALPLIVLYMLRSKRRTVEVASTMLWDRLGAPVSSAVPWQPLKLTPLLLLQLLVLAAFVLSLARPFYTRQALLGPHTVFIVDSSGSMSQAGRLSRALAMAGDLAQQTSAANLVSVVEAGPEPRVLAAFSQTVEPVEEALGGIQAGGAGADLSAAIRLGRGLATPDRPTNLIIFSDGGDAPLPEEPVAAATHIAFNESGPDVSIDAIGIDETDDGVVRAFITATNHGAATLEASFEVVVAGLPAGTAAVELSPDKPASKTIPIDASPGDIVEVRRVGDPDANLLNDAAWVVVGEGPQRTATMLGTPSPFLEALLRSLPGWSEADDGDVMVVDGGELGEIDRPALLIATDTLPEGLEFIELVGNVGVTYQRPGEPLLDQIDLSQVVVAEAQVVEGPSWLPIVRAGDAPLVLLGEVNGFRVAYLSFDITHSNLPIQVGFPILGARLLDWLGGAGGGAVSTGTAGEQIAVSPPTGSTVEVILPSGDVRRMDAAAASFKLTHAPGIYRVRYVNSQGAGEEAVVAVRNFAPEESGGLARALAVQPPSETEIEQSSIVEEWAPWIVALVLVLMATEWWVGHQRPGWQRRREAAA